VAKDNEAAETVSSVVVVVVNTNQPPRITFTLLSPTNGVTFLQPVNLVLAADAFDVDGTVERVDFVANSNVVVSAVAPPYTAVWSNAPAGTYLLQAEALDDRGATGRSTGVSIEVQVPGAITVSQAEMSTNGLFRFQFTGQAGGLFIVEASTNLTTWLPISTIASPTGLVDFVDPDSGDFSWRFYRVTYGPW
jgi:hypothetical protein